MPHQDFHAHSQYAALGRLPASQLAEPAPQVSQIEIIHLSGLGAYGAASSLCSDRSRPAIED